MLQYKKQMNTFDEASITEANIMEGDKKIVMITHDEYTFYSNDGNKTLWILEGEEQFPLHHKGPDASIMVSEFQCPCHISMRSVSDPEKTSRTLFYAGAGRDEWWTAEMMIEQYKEVVKIFDELHPMSQGLFLFDNSSNHSAYAEDALLAGRMNRHTKEVCYETEVVREESSVVSKDDTWRPYRDTWYIRGGRRHVQKICTYTEKNVVYKSGKTRIHRYVRVKGLEAILKERGVTTSENPRTKAKILLSCERKNGEEAEKYYDGTVNYHCCLRHIAARQPDFYGQTTALQEAVANSGHLMELYPKFHCETNWIERYWSACKRVARRECTYSFRDLKENLEDYMNSIPVTEIRNYYNHCWNYIEEYAEDDNGHAMEKRITQRFRDTVSTSHRRLL